jgi:hypothetical protein
VSKVDAKKLALIVSRTNINISNARQNVRFNEGMERRYAYTPRIATTSELRTAQLKRVLKKDPKKPSRRKFTAVVQKSRAYSTK